MAGSPVRRRSLRRLDSPLRRFRGSMGYLRTLRITVLAAMAIATAAIGMFLAAHSSRAAGDTIYALDGPNLISFNSASPGTPGSTIPITGLQDGEAILAIDFRPANGNLYGLGSSDRLYVIDAAFGEANQVGSGTFGTPLEGTYFGFDFAPTTDSLRVVSDTGQNLRVNADTAVVAVDTGLHYAAGDLHDSESPGVVALGYTNNFPGAVTTTAYGVDSALDYVVRLGGPDSGAPGPSSGTLFSLVILGEDATGAVGIDIVGGSKAYALLTIGGDPHLYAVSAITGAVTDLGIIGASFAIADLAVPIPPATPTPSPSPTPTASPSATPPSSPTSTATPTPTPTAGPSPSDTITPTATPGGLTQGDVDCNGVVNSVDALKVLRFVAQLSVSQEDGCPLIGTDVASLFGDINCNDAVNSVDSLGILRFVAQLPPLSAPPGCAPVGEPF